MPIYLSIGIDNRYQSITTRLFAIDWSSIINISRLIDIYWFRLISIVIDYRFHRLDTPGSIKIVNFELGNEMWKLSWSAWHERGTKKSPRKESKPWPPQHREGTLSTVLRELMESKLPCGGQPRSQGILPGLGKRTWERGCMGIQIFFLRPTLVLCWSVHSLFT